MSGHSKWSTIKRKKTAEDQKKGMLFSKLSRAISIAVKVGGGEDPEANAKLRAAIDEAKAANMPKANIDRAVRAAQGKLGELEEVTYEGYGPGGIAVIVEVATDNRNRTGQEIKGIFERGGGHLAGPGAVAYNFEPKGLILVSKKGSVQKQMLKLIDLGAEDVEETEDGIEVYVVSDKVGKLKEATQEEGFIVISSELAQKPKALQTIDKEKEASKALSFLDKLQDHDDVQKVYANLDIPNEIFEKISSAYK